MLTNQISLLVRLNDYGLLQEIWNYLKLKDIINLLITNKIIRIASLAANKIYCVQRINIRNLVEEQINLQNFSHSYYNNPSMALRNMLNIFPNIKVLNIFPFHVNSDHRIYGIGKSLNLLYESESLCRSLQRLNVVIYYDEGITSLPNLSNLTSLYLSFSSVTDHGFFILSNLTRLKHLNLNNCEKITNVSFIQSLTNLIDLEIMMCNNLSSDGLYHLSSLTNLKSLLLSESKKVNDTTMSYICGLTNLETLKIAQCREVSNVGLSHISTLTNLTGLDINHCTIIGNGLSSITTLTNLTILYLNNCNRINNFSYLSFLKNIIILELSSCQKITDEDIFYLKNLKMLRHLSLDRCYQITDIGFSYISTIISITFLSITYCDEITDVGFRLLFLTSLYYLDITGCSKITNEVIDELKTTIIQNKVHIYK